MGASANRPEFPPLLTAGFHAMTLAAVRKLCVTDIDGSATRRSIMDRVTEVIRKVSEAGVTGEFWLDGSFVTEKIDPEDVDTLLRVSSDQYDNDPAKQIVIDWASSEELWTTHSCDAFKWVEYSSGHPCFPQSEEVCEYWTNWFGHSRRGIPKGIIVVNLPAVTP
jgi:hypothetical protein